MKKIKNLANFFNNLIIKKIKGEYGKIRKEKLIAKIEKEIKSDENFIKINKKLS
jgi:hypothetical protein